jgi:Ni/Co efflux regulator RcnB
MKNKTLIMSAAALLLSTSAAFAQRADTNRGRDWDQRYEDRGDRRGERDRGDRDLTARDRVPFQYMQGGRYIHEDWCKSGLDRPPREHDWLRIGNQFVLANRRTGAIADVRHVRSTEPRSSWCEGSKLPYEYMRGGRYIHYDWRNTGLPAPPPQHEWMLVEGQFVLANQRTGMIAEVVDADDRPRRRDGRRRDYR